MKLAFLALAVALGGVALLGAVFGTITELFTPSEFDTVTVPVVIEAVLLILNLFGGLG